MALDILVLIIIGLSVIVAFFRGFIRETLTIAGLVGATIAAIKFGGSFAPVVQGWLSDPNTQETGKIFDLIPVNFAAFGLAYAIIFIGVMILLSIATHYIAKGAQSIGLGLLDRSLGILFGLVRGAVLVGLLYLPFHHLLGEEEKERWFATSKTHVYVEYTARLMQAFIPSPQTEEDGDEADSNGDTLSDPDIAPDALPVDELNNQPSLQPVISDEEPPYNE